MSGGWNAGPRACSRQRSIIQQKFQVILKQIKLLKVQLVGTPIKVNCHMRYINISINISISYLFLCFWLIWFINQRASYNHELSIVHHHCHSHFHLCTPPFGTRLDIETSYLVYICMYAPPPTYTHQIFSDSDL